MSGEDSEGKPRAVTSTSRVLAHQQKMRDLGMVQVREWVPSDKAREIRELAKKLREGHEHSKT
jgi:hypothetical protein